MELSVGPVIQSGIEKAGLYTYKCSLAVFRLKLILKDVSHFAFPESCHAPELSEIKKLRESLDVEFFPFKSYRDAAIIYKKVVFTLCAIYIFM